MIRPIRDCAVSRTTPISNIDFESWEETEDRIEIDLGEAEDTTAAQELFLNQHPRVIRYWVE